MTVCRPLRSFGLLALLAVLLAITSPAGAQTTTTVTTTTVTTTSVTTTSVTTTTVTTTTTTTIAPSAQTVTACTVVSDQPLGAGYHVSGHLSGAASYATGGMTFAVPNTLKAAGRCLCNSFARKPVTVLFGPVAGRTFTYDGTNHTILAYSTAATQVTATTNLSTSTIPFFAVCQ